ncbi:MAG: phosphodiester glycosidase family protein [Muribaculaceae bacterium]
MRRFTFMLFAMVAFASLASGRVTLNGTVYEVDTLMRRQVGPGIMHTRVRVPGYPLNAYVLEVDMTNANNRVETNQAYNRLGRTETLANAYNRHKKLGKKPIAGCNGSFWCVTANTPFNNWMLGSPFGGEVVNDTLYLNTNTTADAWNGGPSRSSSTIIDRNKRVHVGPHQWYGYAKSSKFSVNQEIIQVNKRVDTGQLALFNQAIGRDHTFYTVSDCNYVYLNLKPGEAWQTVNDIAFEVAEVKIDANDQVLGDYDACLVGDGAYKDELAKLEVGDEVVINHYWVALQEDDKTPIAVQNMLEGNAWVLLHGELTARNTDEQYNTMTYSKCAYGNNADGTMLYMIVIDMSTHPVYGLSAGCSTTVMCNLLKFLCPDVWNVTNNDAGGSAQMMVDGTVVNKTTESVPRAVANGFLLFSIAPEEDADVVAELRFDDAKLTSPIYYSIAPKVLGYNKYGELIAEGLEGVTYTCSSSVGAPSSSGSCIEVGGKVGLGTITAHYGDIEVTAPIEVLNSEFSIRLKPMLLIDTTREYPIEITTEVNGETLQYDPSRFDWTIEDATVAEIDHGVLRGLKEGTTKIVASLNDFTEETTVKVEVASQPIMMQPWDDGWTMTFANLSADATIDDDGNLHFGYSGSRKAIINLAKDITFYSLPDSIVLNVDCTTRLLYVQLDMRTPLLPNENLVRPNSEFLETGKYRFDLLDLIDRNDLGSYPVTLKSIEYSFYPTGCNAGENTIKHSLYAKYNNYTSSIDRVTDANKSLQVMAGADGNIMICSAGVDKAVVSIYDISGKTVVSREVHIGGGVASMSTHLAPGLYLVRAQGEGAMHTTKLVVR